MSRGTGGKFIPGPRLPFEPFARQVHLLVGSDAGPVALGWDHDSTQYRAWARAQRQGWMTEESADKLACHLGMHPAEIWGEQWWGLARGGRVSA